MAERIRRAVRNLLETSTWISKEERRQRAIAAAGRFHSGPGDLSEKHDEYLTQSCEEFAG